jgi:hypothetical protein
MTVTFLLLAGEISGSTESGEVNEAVSEGEEPPPADRGDESSIPPPPPPPPPPREGVLAAEGGKM